MLFQISNLHITRLLTSKPGMFSAEKRFSQQSHSEVQTGALLMCW
uniref:Uncharacterized protein n=1 Tax=Anguilla anguilla TaxID=7936 RepID=A0A0E9VGW2_ANGAN